MNDPVSKTPPEENTSESSNAPMEKPEKELTPEEQMALYEENLKETDWGHQPC